MTIMTDEELEEAITHKAATVQYAYNDIAAEIDRSSRNRHTASLELLTQRLVDATNGLSRWTGILAGATVVLAIATIVLVGVTLANQGGQP